MAGRIPSSSRAENASQGSYGYPGEIETRQLGQETLDAHQAALGHRRVTCSAPCVLILDGAAEEPAAAERHELFLAPGEHHLTADFDGRRVDEHTVVAEAGQETPMAFAAPAPEPTQVRSTETQPEPPAIEPPRHEPPPPEPSGLSPVFFWTGAGLTLVLGGVTIWSLVDTLHARDAYVATPTEAGYHDGRKKERRLYAFTGALATVGVATLLTGILGTRWNSGERETARVDLQLGPDGGRLSLQGSF